MKILMLIFALVFSLNAKERLEIKPVDNQLYKKECASCHFGYAPGLLPQKSWSILWRIYKTTMAAMLA